jgi:hypothetical protein
VQDAIHCLWLAHDHVDPALKSEARVLIMSLRKADAADPATVRCILRELAAHLLRVEERLDAMERPCTARTVRRVRDRVAHLAAGGVPPSQPMSAFA